MALPLIDESSPRSGLPSVPVGVGAHRVRLRSIAALVVIWVVLGLWFHLHFPTGLQIFSTASVAFGAAVTVLGLLPPTEKKEWQDGIMVGVHDKLARPAVARSLAWLAGVTLVLGTIVSSVRVETTHGTPAEIRVVDGSESQPDLSAESMATSMRVGHDRAVDIALRLAWPSSRWAHTGSQVSQFDQRVLPWRPARWAYPEDFDDVITLFVLPVKGVGSALISSAGPPRLVLLGGAGDTILTAMPGLNGTRVEFIDRSFHKDSLRASWTRAYHDLLSPPWATAPPDSVMLPVTGADPDSVAAQAPEDRESAADALKGVQATVTLWADAQRVRGRRPLHRGETISFYFADERGPIAAPVEVVLDRNPYPLLIEVSHVVRAHPAAP